MSRICVCVRAIATMALLLFCGSFQSASAHSMPYERLIAAAQSQDIGAAEFPSTQWQQSTAEELRSYCKSALTRIPQDPPRVGITEDGASDIAGMLVEFAQWRLTTIFGDCVELTQEILDERNVHHAIGAWLKLVRLLEHDKTVLNLVVTARMVSPTRDGSYEENIFGTAGWWIVRDSIFAAVLNLLQKE